MPCCECCNCLPIPVPWCCCECCIAGCKKIPVRFFIITLIFFSAFINFAFRADISYSLATMIDTPIRTTCLPLNDKQKLSFMRDNITYFEWTKIEEMFVYCTYFSSYFVFALFGGLLVDGVGAYNTIFYTSIISVFGNTISPFTALRGSWTGLGIIRFFMGMVGGIWYPSMNILIQNWSPVNEKGHFIAALLCGTGVGVAITWIIMGAITQASNWKMALYTISLTGAVFSFFFALLASSHPKNHFLMSDKELDKIESQNGAGSFINLKPVVITYGQLFKSGAFMAAIFADFTSEFAINVLLIYYPEFLSRSFKITAFDLGVRSSIPFIVYAAATVIFNIGGRIFRDRVTISYTARQKITIMFTHFAPAACFLLLPHNKCNLFIITLLMVIALFFTGGTVLTHVQNQKTIPANYAGRLYGFKTGFAAFSGFWVALVTFMTLRYNPEHPFAPYVIFDVTGALLILSGIIFILFGSGQYQTLKDISAKNATEDSKSSMALTVRENAIKGETSRSFIDARNKKSILNF